MKPFLDCLISLGLFVIIAVGGWSVHIFLLPLPVQSLASFFFRVAYFLIWLILLIGLAGRTIVGRRDSNWHIIIYAIVGTVIGFHAGFAFAGYGGMFVGAFIGPIIGTFVFFGRMWALSATDAPLPSLSTDPTSYPVTLDDLVGLWQFYMDNASRTVSINFQSDGTFTERIISNQGGVQECQGGTWTLKGAFVHLNGYVATSDGSTKSCTWWMIDTPSGLALFGGDGPDVHSFFRTGVHRQ